ncbi:MAG TPA: sodium:proton antiporter, partial [Casimicrobiaceae bacterium]|nr:sodium:proton antiporter [Casimicrobiaceae bacterium]
MPAFAADAGSGLNGAALSPLWVVPFAGILLSIALMPVTAPGFWHHHFGKTTAFWAFALLVPLALNFGLGVTAREVVHTLLAEYVPFIILLFALFTVSGGLHVRGNLRGSAWQNTRLLALGTVLASVMGTTGASMLLIRPLLRANDNRRHRAHVVVFFIFLVANIGGALTPLGDPPLFLGFLKGVDFFWTTKAMLLPTLTATLLLLALFFVLDRWFWRLEDGDVVRPDPTPDSPTGIDGKVNFLLLGGILALVLMSGIWKPDLEVVVYGTPVELQNLARDVGLLAI